MMCARVIVHFAGSLALLVVDIIILADQHQTLHYIQAAQIFSLAKWLTALNGCLPTICHGSEFTYMTLYKLN